MKINIIGCLYGYDTVDVKMPEECDVFVVPGKMLTDKIMAQRITNIKAFFIVDDKPQQSIEFDLMTGKTYEGTDDVNIIFEVYKVLVENNFPGPHLHRNIAINKLKNLAHLYRQSNENF